MNSQLTINSYRQYIWVIGVAVLLRGLWAVLVPVSPVSDSVAYDTFAQNLALCQNYGWDCTEPTAYWPVGTSFAYSILYRVFGLIYQPLVLFNIAVNIITIVLSQYLAGRWFGPRTGLVTGLLLAIWPGQIQFTTTLNSELLFNMLWVGALAFWYQREVPLLPRSIGTGILLAGASYVKSQAILIPILLMLIHYADSRKIWQSITAAMVILATIGLLIMPWSMRNSQAFDQFVLLSTNGGANLWMGNNPESTGIYMPLPPEVETMNEAERNQYLKTLAKDHIKDQPVLFAKRVVTRLFDTYIRETIGIVWNQAGLVERYGEGILMPLKLISQLFWLGALGLALLGAALLVINYGWFFALFHPTVLFWAYFAAIHGVIVAQDRYHIPSVPMMAVLAALSITTLVPKVAGSPRPQEKMAKKVQLH